MDTRHVLIALARSSPTRNESRDEAYQGSQLLIFMNYSDLKRLRLSKQADSLAYTVIILTTPFSPLRPATNFLMQNLEQKGIKGLFMIDFNFV